MFSSGLDWVMVLGRKTAEVKRRSHHIPSRAQTGNLTDRCAVDLALAEVCLPGFSTEQLLFPLVRAVLVGRKS